MQNGCRWFIERLIAAPALAALMALSLPAPAHAQQVVKIGEIEAQTGSLNTLWLDVGARDEHGRGGDQ
jgi:hypothetical protein